MMISIIICYIFWIAAASALENLVTLGSNVTLACDISVKFEILWFVQHPNKTMSLALLTTIKLDKTLTPTKHFDIRLVPSYNMTEETTSLHIVNVTETDLGLYYCAERISGSFRIGSGTQLSLTSEQHSTPHLVVGIELPWFITLLITPMIAVFAAAVFIYCKD